MAHRVKIRGIYSTALTRLLLNSGYVIIEPTPEIRRRFNLPETEERADIRIRDRRDRQGIEVTGEPDRLSLLIRLIQETLFDSLLTDFSAQAEPPGEAEDEADAGDIALARFEFPGFSKAYLDAIRSTVVPSLKNHHRFKIIQEKKLARLEEELLRDPSKKESLENDFFAQCILAPLETAETARCEQIKASGKPMRPREGHLLERRTDKLIFKRSFSGGRYDGLNLAIEEGDYGITEVREGCGFVKHAYFSGEGRLKGEYFNINTPAEFYPFGARFVDLEIDVIRRAGEKPRISDREELAFLVKKGIIGAALQKKAIETAEALAGELEAGGKGAYERK